MSVRSRTMGLALMAVALSSTVAPSAHADAIDGDWCHGASHLHIEGSSILTPGRNKIEGLYNRYRFAYTVPPNEPGAGSEVKMVMIRGQEIVHLERHGQNGAPEIWRRCKPIS